MKTAILGSAETRKRSAWRAGGAAILVAAAALVAAPMAWGQQTPAPKAPEVVRPAMPVRGGTVVLKVTDFGAARQQVIKAALAEGGQVLDARTSVSDKGRRHGWIRLRMGGDHLERLLPAVRGVGKLYAENLGTAEQASDYEDLGRRVVKLQEHQARLDALLKSSRRLRGSDILYVQERLFRAGVDEGMLEQQRLDMERRARTATLTVELFEPYPVRALDRAKIDLSSWYVAAKDNASHRLNRMVARGTTAVAYVFVFAPLWLPVVVAGLLLLRLLWTRSRSLRVFLVSQLFPLLIGAVATVFTALATWLQKRRSAARPLAPAAPAGIAPQGFPPEEGV